MWSEKKKNREEKRKGETSVCLQGTEECEVAQFELRRQTARINKSLNQVYSTSLKILVGFYKVPRDTKYRMSC